MWLLLHGTDGGLRKTDEHQYRFLFRLYESVRISAGQHASSVLDGLRGEETIAELCRREGIAQSIYYKWSKEFFGSWQAEASR